MAEQLKISFSVAIIGLDGGGKTTMVRSLVGSKAEIYPTAGFEINYVVINEINNPVLVFDCSG